MHPLARKTFLKAAALLLGCALAVAGMPLRGLARDPDEIDAPAPPPEGVPMKIEVPRGRAVLITLSAYSITSPIIRFKIKRAAQAGKLGTPRLASASTAQVRYQPPAGAGPGQDSFIFEVQSAAGVSAPAEVDITLTDKDPLFIAPTDIEFGQVLTGGSVRRSLDLQNLGGGIAEGTVKVPDGWTVDGDPDYHLGPGAKQTFTLIFTPTDQTAYTGDIEYTGDLERATDLNGEGVGPLAVTTGSVQLTPAGAVRSGVIHVVNRTGVPLTVHLLAGSVVKTDPSAMVPANGGTDIAVSATGAEAISDDVTVEGQGLKTDVAVYAAGPDPTPPPEAATTPPPQSTPGGPAAASPPAPGTIAQAASNGPTPAPDNNDDPSMSLPPLIPDSTPQSQPRGIEIASLQAGLVSRTNAEVACDFKGDPQADAYRLELQTIGIDSGGRAFAKWIPFPGATLSTHAQAVIAQMPDLQPATLYVVRIVGVDNEGQILEISSPPGVTTLPEPPPWWRQWMKEEVVIVVAGAGYWWWRAKKSRRSW
jgi:hypothetical protein